MCTTAVRRGGSSEIRRLAEDQDAARRELAYAVLLAVDGNPKAPVRAKTQAENAIEAAWKEPRLAATLLRAIGRTDSVKYAFQVRNHMKDQHADVKKAAAHRGRSSRSRP